MSHRLQGNLPRQDESKTRGVPEPPPVPTSASRVGDCTSANTSGVAMVHQPGPERRVLLPGKHKIYPCPVCGKMFSDKRNKRRHVKTVHDCKVFTCLKCTKTFSSRTGLQKHSTSSHSNSTFQCPLPSCANYYTTMTKLQYHVRKCSDGVRIRKCSCSLSSKFHPQYCFQVLKNGSFSCTPPPAKNQPKGRQLSKQVLKKEKKRKPITLRGQLLEKIRLLYITHPNLHPRVAKFRKRYGYPAHQQKTIPWVPIDPGTREGSTHRVMQVIRKKIVKKKSTSPPSPLLSSSGRGKDMPLLHWEEKKREVDEKESLEICLDLQEEELNFEA